MVLAYQLFGELGLKNIRVEMNSLGVPAERRAHREALVAYFEQHSGLLDGDAQRRLHTNPLRILDTKNPAMQEMVQGAPQLLSYLGESSLKHLDTVKRLLDACDIEWKVNARLVRGLDYYSHTVFEFITDELGAQGTLCGGGRYDGLFEVLGGKPTPAVGWGMGLERVLELVGQQSDFASTQAPNAYAVVPSADALPVAMKTLHALRAMDVSVQMHSGTAEGMGSMKSQFKKADASGAGFALIFGSDELAAGMITVKSLRDGSGAQVQRPLAEAASWAATLKP
jgi:histidyl-tRNA synthetase